jgi:uncharacterized membrane protein
MSYKKTFWTSLRDIFLTGLFVFIPIVITIWLVFWLLGLVNNLILPVLNRFFPIPNIPGIGLLLTIIFIFVIGLLAQNYFGKKILELWDTFIDKIPLVRSVYHATRQMMENLFDGKTKFRKTVLVDFPRKGMLSIGFVANEVMINEEEYYVVYVPTAPNPTSGYTLFVKKDEVIHTDMSVEEATRIILSGGIVTKQFIRIQGEDKPQIRK